MAGNTSTYGSCLKEGPEEVVVNIFYVASADSPMFDELTKKAYDVLQEDMQPYCSVYTAAFDKAVELHQEATVEDLMESVDFLSRIHRTIPVRMQTMKIQTMTV